MCDEVAHLLYSLVKFHKPDTIIQTGHLWGKSACAALQGMTDATPIEDQPQDIDPNFAGFVDSRRPKPTNKRFISIDPRPLEVPRPTRGVEYLQKTYPSVRVEHAKMRSDEFFATFREPVGRLFGIVDGDHSEAGCFGDLLALERLNADWIVVDDAAFIPEVRRATGRFSERGAYFLTMFELYNGIGLLTKR